MMSLVSWARLPSVSATWTSISGLPLAAPSGANQVGNTHGVDADLVVPEVQLPRHGWCVVGGHGQFGIAGQQLAAQTQHLVVDGVRGIGAQQRSCFGNQGVARLGAGGRRGGGRLQRQAARHFADSRSQGRLAMPCATSQVSATLIGQISSSGASIQSRSRRTASPAGWGSIGHQGRSVGPLPEQGPTLAEGGGGTRPTGCFMQRFSEAIAQAAHGGDADGGPARSSCAGGGCRPRWRCC